MVEEEHTDSDPPPAAFDCLMSTLPSWYHERESNSMAMADRDDDDVIQASGGVPAT